MSNATHLTDLYPTDYPVTSPRELAHFLRWEIATMENALERWTPHPINDYSPEFQAGYLAGVTNALNALEGMTE